jgi:hypothetical protein
VTLTERHDLLARRVTALERRLVAVERTLDTLLHWLPQSANSPLRPDECRDLRDILHARGRADPGLLINILADDQ